MNMYLSIHNNVWYNVLSFASWTNELNHMEWRRVQKSYIEMICKYIWQFLFISFKTKKYICIRNSSQYHVALFCPTCIYFMYYLFYPSSFSMRPKSFPFVKVLFVWHRRRHNGKASIKKNIIVWEWGKKDVV